MTTIARISLAQLISMYEMNSDSVLVKDILWELSRQFVEWEDIIYDLRVFKPKCEELGYCPEARGCGKMSSTRE